MLPHHRLLEGSLVGGIGFVKSNLKGGLPSHHLAWAVVLAVTGVLVLSLVCHYCGGEEFPSSNFGTGSLYIKSIISCIRISFELLKLLEHLEQGCCDFERCGQKPEKTCKGALK